MAPTPLRVLLFHDGRPGHYHLSDGIVAALSRRRATSVERLQVGRNGWPGHALAWLLRARVPPEMVLHRVYRLRERLPPADVIVSAGSETLAANVSGARLLGIPNLFYGSLRQFQPQMFSLSLTSYAERIAHPSRAMFLKPSAIDPDRFPSLPMPGSQPSTAGLIIGGDAPGFRYSADDWRALIEFMGAAHSDLGLRWIVANSPRTATAVSDRLRDLASTRPRLVSRFIDVRQMGAGTLVELLSSVSAVVCTADSSTMASEAVWCKRPVLAVTPAGHEFTAAEQGYRDYLERSGWYRSLPLTDLSPASYAREIAQIVPLRDNPLDRLATLIGSRLPELSV